MIAYGSATHNKHVDTVYGHGKWPLIRKYSDNSRAATVKLRYQKLAVSIQGWRLIEEIRYTMWLECH